MLPCCPPDNTVLTEIDRSNIPVRVARLHFGPFPCMIGRMVYGNCWVPFLDPVEENFS